MAAVIIPARAGVLSAAGILAAPVGREVVHTWPTPSDLTGLDGRRTALAADVAALVGATDGIETLLDCRYPGQAHEITVADVDEFGAAHERINGHERPGSPVEVVAVRARAWADSPVHVLDLPAPAHRTSPDPVEGPAVVAEPDCTIWVPEGWRAVAGEAGALVLRRSS
jgi:N-methylhydantoinase A/oxoprolinase/acetone carboxylase beta subunit